MQAGCRPNLVKAEQASHGKKQQKEKLGMND